MFLSLKNVYCCLFVSVFLIRTLICIFVLLTWQHRLLAVVFDLARNIQTLSCIVWDLVP